MEKDPKALRVLLNRLNGLALSKRERPQVEDLLRQAYDAGVRSALSGTVRLEDLVSVTSQTVTTSGG